MSENRCEGCPKRGTLIGGWECCMGNRCEVDVRADERAKIIDKIHSFFASELDKLETETDDDFEYFKDTEKVDELLRMNKRICRMIKEAEKCVDLKPQVR